jgi:hypothetical protein
MSRLSQTIPALPVRDAGAEGVDEPYEELRAQDVLHPVSKEAVADTDFGTREFATLDRDGNLVTFFQWVSQ